MKIERFEGIESWKEAQKLTNEVYRLINRSVFAKDWRLKDQIQRAFVLIMSNIAEGFDSGSNRFFSNFQNCSFRSVSEVQSLLYVAQDREYINSGEFSILYEECVKIKSLTGGFQ